MRWRGSTPAPSSLRLLSMAWFEALLLSPTIFLAAFQNFWFSLVSASQLNTPRGMLYLAMDRTTVSRVRMTSSGVCRMFSMTASRCSIFVRRAVVWWLQFRFRVMWTPR